MNVKELALENNEVNDVSPLSGLTNLEFLRLSNNDVNDVSPLKDLVNLQHLGLQSNQVSDITPLGGLTNIIRFDLERNQITDISPLDGLANLEFLRVRNNQITHVSLSDLPSLWGLDLVSNQLTLITLSGSGLPNLQHLELGVNQLTDVSGLAGMTNLEYLILSNNQLTDISGLADMTKMNTLWLSWNPLSDISPIAGLTNLEYLYARYTEVMDLSPLAGLTKLYNLDLRNNQISDISPLAGLTNLYYLVMTDNMVTHIPPLTGATQLAEIWLGHNQISDISGLASLVSIRGVDLSYNWISDIQPLVDNPAMDEGDTVVLYCNPLSGKAIFTDIPILLDRGVDILFDYDADTDGDGLFDRWETYGIDINCDGIIDLDLPALGADPLHKDLFVEVDSMEGRAPTQAALNLVIDAFAKAPNNLLYPPNPDGNDGITLHIQLDKTDIPRYVLRPYPLYWDDFDDIKKAEFGLAEERINTDQWRYIEVARKLVFRYCIFADAFLSICPDGKLIWNRSGFAELPGNDFVITLGEWNPPGGTDEQQAGAFMHELGHNLNLHHGGDDDINFKPNYKSVMNYHWTFRWPKYEGWELDYSRVPPPGMPIPMLDESHLIETLGIEGPPGIKLPVGPPPQQFVYANEPVDWNRDGDKWDVDVNEDINYLKDYLDPKNPCCPRPSPGQKLRGHCDWPVLWYWLGGDPQFQDGVHDPDIEPEMSYDEYKARFETTEIDASVDFDPDVLNLASRAKVVTVYIELLEGFDVGDIDISTLKLNDSVVASSKPVDVDDYDLDGVPDLMVKFDCKEVAEILDVGQQTVTLSGELADGTQFIGTDTIRVINMKGITVAESELESVVSHENVPPNQDEVQQTQTDTGPSEVSDAKEGIAFMLSEINQIIVELGPESFNSAESAFELACAIDDLFMMLDEGMYFEAMAVLEFEVLPRTDGYANISQPDDDDWITSIEGQALLYPIVIETISLFESMIE